MKNVLETQEISVVVIDSDFNVKYCNPAIWEMFGYKKKKLKKNQSINVSELFPELTDLIVEKGHSLFEGVSATPLDCQVCLGNIWVKISFQSIKQKGENLLQIILQKITEKIRLEEQFNLAFENTIDSMFWVDIETGNIINCNSAAEKLLGEEKEKIIKNYHTYIYPQLQSENFLNSLKKHEEKRTVFVEEGVVITKYGREIPIYITMSITTVGKKQIIQCVFHDITDQKDAEKKLRESEQKFKLISEQSLLGILFIQDGRIKYVNEAAAKIIGYTTQEMRRWTPNYWIKLIHPEEADYALNLAKRRDRGEFLKENYLQYRIFSKSRELKWLYQFSKSVPFQGTTAYLVTLIDITDWKKAEQKLFESEKKYRNAFKRMEFYKDLISHDITNILQNITFSTESALIFIDDTEKVKGRLNDIQDGIKRCSKFIQTVRKLSKLDTLKFPLYIVEIHKIINKGVEFIEDLFCNRDLKIEIKAFRQELFIQANEFLLDVIENILHNAVIHNVNSSVEIIIQIAREDSGGNSFVRLEFIDNGIGIEDCNKEIIFERGYKEAQNISGTGIGLSLVKKIIINLGGKIWVEDRVKGILSKGSKFVLLIPQA